MTPSRKSNGGFTLVELMVALTLGLLISGTAIAVFITSTTTSRVSEALAHYQESFRYASHVISRDIRMAGFMGCNSTLAPMTVAKIDTGIAYDAPIRGYESSSPSGISSRAAGTDVLQVQFSASAGHRLTRDMTAADETISVAGAADDFAAGDFAIISDCTTATLFQVTSVSGGDTTPLVLSHGTSGNTSAYLASIYTGPSEVFDFIIRYYFATVTRDGRNVLMRQTLRYGAAIDEEIADGIEDVQFLYGIDTDELGDQTANKYIKASDVTDWGRVVSVRVCLLTRSQDDHLTTGKQTYYGCDGKAVIAKDRRLRAPSFFTVSLRNRTS